MPGSSAWEPLYDLVGTGMWAYTNAAFRVRFVGERGWRIRRGEMLVATHRAETDVPLICGQVFFPGRVCFSRKTRLHFAAREDMFERGFFAGFPPGLPIWARRLLYPLDVGPFLPHVRVRPLPYPSADLLRLGRALEEVETDTRLAELLPGELVCRLEDRARRAGLRRPTVVSDVLRGEFADILFESYPREVLCSPLLEPVWRRRLDRATEQIREIIDLIRAGEPILFFPEGRPSPDGAIGPFRPGLRLLVRRAKPASISPVALSYDRIVTGRPLAYFAMGRSIEPPGNAVDDVLLGLLRRTMPLTCGQTVAVVLREAASSGRDTIRASELESRLVEELAAARASERPFDERLENPGHRYRRLEEALQWATQRGLVLKRGPRDLGLEPEAVLANHELAYAALEYASARERPA